MVELRRKFLGAHIVVQLTVFLYLILLSLFQTDPHHDGYILGSASAVASGLPVHAGAFSQYGPATPLIAGLFMKLAGVSVLSMRILAAILVFITYVLIERMLIRMEFKKSVSRLFAVSWVVLNQVVSTTFDGSLFLWPSVISTLFLMVSVYLVCNSNKSNNYFYFLIAAGVVVALATFTRIQSILVIPVILLFTLLRKKFRIQVFAITLGFLIGCVTICFSLYASGALDDFIYQAIVWPSRAYPSLGSGNNYNRFQFALYVSLSVGMVMFYWAIRFIGKRVVATRHWIIIGLSGTVVFLVSWASGRLLQSNHNTYLRLFVGDQFNRILLWPLYFSFAVTLFVSLMTLTTFFWAKWRVQEFDFGPSFAILTGASVTVQIFPQPDVAHLWWITPLFIVPTLLLLKVINVDFYSVQRTVSVLLVAAFFANAIYFSKDWELYKYKPLEGTFALASKARAVDIYQPLSSYLGSKKAIFICYDGLHAVASGKYSSIDPWFVYWGFDSGSVENEVRLARAADIVICDKERNFSDAIASKFGKKIVFFEENRQGDTYRSLAILENKEKN